MKIFTAIRKTILFTLLIFKMTHGVIIEAILTEKIVAVVSSVAVSLSACTINFFLEKQKEAGRRVGKLDKNLVNKILSKLDDPEPLVDGKFTDLEKQIRHGLVEHYRDPIKAAEWAHDCENIVKDFLKIDGNDKNQTIKAFFKILSTTIPEGALKYELESAKNYLISEFSKGTLFENINEINEKLYYNLYLKVLEGESHIVKKCWAYGVKFPPSVLPKIDREFVEEANNKKINSLLDKSELNLRGNYEYGTDHFLNYFKINKLDPTIVYQISDTVNNYQDDLDKTGILKKNYSLNLKNYIQQIDDSKKIKYGQFNKLAVEIDDKWKEQVPLRLFNKIRSSLNNSSISFLTRNLNDPVADVLIKKNLDDISKGRLNLEKSIIDKLKSGIIQCEESLKLIKQFYGNIPENLTKEENLWLYIIAESVKEKVLQHELIQTVYVDFNIKNYKRIYNFFYDQDGFLKKYSSNPIIKNINSSKRLNRKAEIEIISNINRLLFWQECYTPGSDEYCCLQKSIEELIISLESGKIDNLSSKLSSLVNHNIKLDNQHQVNKSPLERILDDLKTAQISKPLSPEEIIEEHEKIWQDIQLSSKPLLVLKYYADKSGMPEAQKILEYVIELESKGLPRFIIEDHIFASIITIRSSNIELANHLIFNLNKHLEKIKASGLDNKLEFALFRDEADQLMPLYLKKDDGTNARGYFTENDPDDPDHCKELMKFLKQMAPEFKNEMLKVEKLIEDIVNDIYRNSNNEDLINKKIHLSTDLDKLLYHVVHGELRKRLPSGIHFDLEELKARCCFQLKLKEIIGNGVKLMTVQSKRNGNIIEEKSIFENLKPQNMAKKLYDALINKKYKIEDEKIIDFVEVTIDGIETRVDIKGGSKINTIYPAKEEII